MKVDKLCISVCHTNSAPIFRLFECRDSIRLHFIQCSDVHTWTLQFRKRFLFRSPPYHFGGGGIKESFFFFSFFLLFDFTVWLFASEFTHFILSSFFRIRDSTMDTVRAEWETTLLIYLMENALILVVVVVRYHSRSRNDVISTAISRNTLRKGFSENTIYINANIIQTSIWCIEFNLVKRKIENYLGCTNTTDTTYIYGWEFGGVTTRDQTARDNILTSFSLWPRDSNAWHSIRIVWFQHFWNTSAS